jgi:hypothetical protein
MKLLWQVTVVFRCCYRTCTQVTHRVEIRSWPMPWVSFLIHNWQLLNRSALYNLCTPWSLVGLTEKVTMVLLNSWIFDFLTYSADMSKYAQLCNSFCSDLYFHGAMVSYFLFAQNMVPSPFMLSICFLSTRVDYIQGMLAIIQFKIFVFPSHIRKHKV